MKLITFAGSPASGKTSVILKAGEYLKNQGKSVGVMKLDCISSDDDEIYRGAGVSVIKFISGNMCPDHFFASHIGEVFDWGLSQKLDVLITESAGLCGRCAPHLRNIAAVCVIDCLAGITSPFKAGPMLFFADYIAVTKGDLVSPCEREVFLHNIRLANSRAKINFINGLSGQGSSRLSSFIASSEEISTVSDKFLRFTMPAASCNFCSGQMWVGSNKSAGSGRIKWGGEN
ncbi:GTP-binding protein [Treponema sp. UBA3813]|uniref:GTP-binding protein n=1 Tax=Treponema sp. UBA3813 TaxID=1947715 RepID=UPI0025EAF916|nr:GTP-binding protein [Treponema sp. UBA3813]